MNLESVRREIDKLDLEMMELFKTRMELAKQIGQYKNKYNITITDKQREIELINNKRIHFNTTSLWLKYEKLIKQIIELSKDVQNEV